MWPTPDATYTLTGRIKVGDPPRLSDTNPFPLCPPAFTETLRTACIMAAEIRHIQMKPPVPYGRGRRVWIPRPSQEEFNERLAASIGLDAKLRPDSLGYVGDGTSDRNKFDPYSGLAVSYNGVYYGP
jgi:hypothetical protein